MKTAAIICEFNPFHNGHKYLLNTARRLGYDRIIAIMSGSFTQRGDVAVISKFLRAAVAISEGADLVVELPVTYAVSPAQRFAMGGVQIASELGADALVFGSECGNLETLKSLAEAAYSKQFKPILQENMSEGKTFAAAREAALLTITGLKNLPTSPNDNLAVEYISAINKLNKNIIAVPVKRVGTNHDSCDVCDGFCSASYIRNNICDDKIDFSKYMPSKSLNIFEKCIKRGEVSEISALDNAFIYRLRTMTEEDFANLPDISEGLENRFFNAARTANSFEELIFAVKSKRYTLSRIRRIAIHAIVGTSRELYDRPIEYIRVLGFNGAGANIISNCTSHLPIITKPTLLKGNPIFELEARATDIHMLSMKISQPSALDYTNGIITEKNIHNYFV